MTLEPIQFLFNDNINIYLQSYGNAFVDNLFKAITTFGSEPVYVFLASLIFWCFSKKTGLRVMYVILFSAFATILAKNLFAMPRPPEYLYKIAELLEPDPHSQTPRSLLNNLSIADIDNLYHLLGREPSASRC